MEHFVHCAEPNGIRVGQAVYLAGTGIGTSSGLQTVRLARADVPSTMPTIGLAARAGRLGDVITIEDGGMVGGVDTSASSANALLYCSPSVAGACTVTRPALPAIAQACGRVVRVGVNNGIVAVDLRIPPAGLSFVAEIPGGNFVGQAKWADF